MSFSVVRKKRTSKAIDAYIAEYNYEKLINEKRIVLDSKQGDYMEGLTSKDEAGSIDEV